MEYEASICQLCGKDERYATVPFVEGLCEDCRKQLEVKKRYADEEDFWLLDEGRF
jgi:hypothetical protein